VLRGIPGLAWDTVQELVDIQAEIVAELGLSARVLLMPSEELGASAYQKVPCSNQCACFASVCVCVSHWGMAV
jgi:seryl-tRNA synthetase